MSDETLPPGWAHTKFDAFGELYCGQSLTASKVNREGIGTPYVTGPEHWDGKDVHLDKWSTEPARLVPDGCIFITVKGAGVGTLFPGVACAIGRDIYAFKPSSAIDRKFVELSLRFSIAEVVSEAKGDIPGLSKSHILDHSIPLPPLAEQKRIVAKIEELFSELEAGEASLRQARRQLGVYRQSLLKQAFEGKLTQKWRTQNGGSNQPTLPAWENSPDLKTRRDVPDNVQLPELLEDVSLPAGWVLRSTAHLLKKGVLLDVKDGNHGTNHPKKADFTATGLPFLTAAEIRDFKIDFDGSHKIAGEPLKKLHVGFSKPRDVILTHKGSVGRVAVNDRDAMLSPQTTYYRCSENILLPEFLCYYFSSPLFVAQLGEVKGQTTRDFVPISKQYFLFSVVAPLPEQQEIVRLLDEQFEAIERNERELDAALQRSEALRQSILKKAFTGRLVPQDPADEPASALLARLLAERISKPVSKRQPARQS